MRRSAAVAPEVKTTTYAPTGALRCWRVASRAAATAAAVVEAAPWEL